MHRKDYRSKQQFINDIYFTTKVESFLWNKFCNNILVGHEFTWKNNGTDNSGKFVEKSNSNADYLLNIKIGDKYEKFLLEIKFAPSNNKATFKVLDLEAYIKQNAHILLFYNTGKNNLKKTNSSIEEHIQFLEKHIKYIKYALISPDNIKKMLNSYQKEKIYYMGNKECIIVPSIDFDKYFTGKSL